MSDKQFFLFVVKKVDRSIFEVKFTGDYYDFAVIPYLFRNEGQKSKKTEIFIRFFDFWPWSWNNYEMIPTT